MIGRYFYTLFFLLFAFNANSSVFVVFNPDECSSCIKSLEYLKDLDNTIRPNFIFNEKYKRDSLLIIEKFFLSQYHASYTWSDSLYNSFIRNGNVSTVRLVLDDNEHVVSLPLKLLNRENIKIFNRLSKSVDTIFVGSAMQNIDYSELSSSGLNLLFVNNIRNEFYSYNTITNSVNFKAGINDSITRASYDIALGKNSYQKHFDQMNLWKVPKIMEIQNSWLQGDTAFLVMKCKFMDTLFNQLVVNKFYTLNTFVKGRLEKLQFIRNAIEEKVDSFYFFPFMNLLNEKLYGSIIKFNRLDSSRYFLTALKPFGDELIKDSFYQKELPPVYESYDYANPIFFNRYFALPLEDKIYSFDTKEIVEIYRFPLNNQATVYTPPKMYVQGFKINREYVWLLYYQEDSKKYNFLKFDRKNKKIMFDKSFDYSSSCTPVIYDFNYNCLAYKTNSNEIIINNFSLH